MSDRRAYRAFAVLVGLVAAACGAPPARLRPSTPVNPSTAIVGATLWDGTGRAPVTNAVTVVRGDRILCAGAAGECPVPQGARVIDAQGQYLIPGLIDSHVHLLFLTNGSAGEELGLDLRDLLAQGVTTVRDMGTNPAALLSRVSGLRGRAPRLRHAARRRPPLLLQRLPGGADGAAAWSYRQPPALTMQGLGWNPIQYNRDDDPEAVVARGPPGRGDGAQALRPARQRVASAC